MKVNEFRWNSKAAQKTTAIHENYMDLCNLNEDAATAPSTDHMLMTPKSRATDNQHHTPEMTPKQDPNLVHLQRDFNSPSAALRMRALRAIKSPSKAIYNNFDVPHHEISIITAEERNPLPPPTLSEILQDVIVYVEVRTGNDNRSEGVKSIIAKLGAQVNDRLLRNTTHVVFKDGVLSTYKRAQSWNIPIVSILWIEACKVQRRICEPQQFPISNIHMYEYPELYGKLTRVRCMQPDSELNKRPRKRQGTPTGTKDKELAKKRSTQDTPTTTPKNDITRFFKPLSQNKLLAEGELTESPATKLLNRMTNGCFTPLNKQTQPDECTKTNETDLIEIENDSSREKPAAQKSLDFSQGKRVVRSCSMTVLAPQVITPERASRRRSSMHESTRAAPKDDQVQFEPRLTRRRSLLNMSQGNEQNTPQPIAEPEPRMTRRRSSMQLVAQTYVANTPEPPAQQDTQISRRRSFSTVSAVEPSTPKLLKKPSFQAIAEEPLVETSTNHMSMDMSTPTTSTRTPIYNKTNYAHQTMDISESRALIVGKATQRRTLYTMDHMEMSDIRVENTENINPYMGYNVQANVTTQTSMDSIGEHTPVPVFSSTRLPGSGGGDGSSSNRRRSLINLDLGLINERINKLNSTSQRRSLALANKAELGECRVLSPLQAVASEPKSTEPKMRRLYTPNDDVFLSSVSNSSSKSRQTSPSTGTVKRRRTLAAPKPTAAVGPTLQKPCDSNTESDPDSGDYMTPINSYATTDIPSDGVLPAAKRRTIHTLVHTNMRKEQVQVIYKVGNTAERR